MKNKTLVKSFQLKKIFVFQLLGLSFLCAQYQLPVYSDYLTDNYFLVHPAMAGAQFEGAKIRMTHRTQWAETPEAPNLLSLNGHTRIGMRSGIGAVFFRDKNGYQSRMGGSISYAHHINFFRSNIEINQLSFGINVGGVNNIHDQTSFDPYLRDPLMEGTRVNSKSIYIDAGFSYNRLQFYAHLTFKNLLFYAKNINDQVLIEKPKSVLFSAGHFFEINPKWALEPSVLTYWLEYANLPIYDVNLKTHHHLSNLNSWMGVSFRRGITGVEYANNGMNLSDTYKQFTFLAGIEFNLFSISYSFTNDLGSVNFSNKGYHQLTLGINLTSNRFRIYPIRGIL